MPWYKYGLSKYCLNKNNISWDLKAPTDEHGLRLKGRWFQTTRAAKENACCQ